MPSYLGGSGRAEPRATPFASPAFSPGAFSFSAGSGFNSAQRVLFARSARALNLLSSRLIAEKRIRDLFRA